MSVLINMEMPTSCDDCRFAVDGWCYACPLESEVERKQIVTNYCPLVPVPPHGDLIDRNILLKSKKYIDILSDDGYIKVQTIEDMPAIIPADRKDDTK